MAALDSIPIMDFISFSQVCLFNIAQDPCEMNNLVFKYPDIVRVSFHFLSKCPLMLMLMLMLVLMLMLMLLLMLILLQMLESTLRLFNATAVPPGNKPIDSRADPKWVNQFKTYPTILLNMATSRPKEKNISSFLYECADSGTTRGQTGVTLWREAVLVLKKEKACLKWESNGTRSCKRG